MDRTTQPMQLYKLLLIVLYFSDFYKVESYRAITFCQYHGDSANCSGFGHNLTFIPPLKLGIRKLVFNNNFLPRVTNATFKNISTDSIHYLDLWNDGIENVSQDAFNTFSNLDYFGLVGNKIQTDQLKCLLGNLSKLPRLRKLFLDNLSFKIFPNDLLSMMNNSRVNFVSLESNGIEVVNASFFLPLKYLSFLDMNSNVIRSFHLPILFHLETLHLDRNNLEYIPNFCHANSAEESTVPSLRSLFLMYNQIRQVSNIILRCLPKLYGIYLRGNYISLLPNYMLANLQSLEWLDLSHIYAPTIKVHPYAFKSNSLRVFDFSNNKKAEDIISHPQEIFKHSPNLRRLQLETIGFSSWSDERMAQMLSNLSTLRSISHRKCQINFAPIKLFNGMPNLEHILLGLNYIRELSPLSFASNTHLKNLSLEGNKISQLKQAMLPLKLLNNLQRLSMKNNPYACNCELEWFIKWLKSTYNDDKNVLIKGYPNEYRCASPSSLVGTRLHEVSFTYRQCHPWGTGFWIGVIGCPTVFFIIIVAAVVYRNRWNIKHYIYLLRRRKEYNRIEGQNYIYDAFVAYNEHDFQWVIQHLLPVLETQEGYKLCVHDRDFQPGVFINDNISSRMEESRNIIIAMSDKFVTSNWCRYEMKLAHAKQIEDNTNLIVVILEMPKARHMSTELKTLLHSTTYIVWTDDVVGQNLFWNKIKDAMKT